MSFWQLDKCLCLIARAILIAAYCSSPPLIAQAARRSTVAEIAAARVAFPSRTPVRDADGVRWTFQNHRLIETSFGPVLISEGRVDERDMAHVTSGRLDVTYLARENGVLYVRRRFPEAVSVGSFGGIGEWAVSYRFSTLPVIYAAGGFTGQGITEGCTILTELAPSGPRTVAVIPDSYSNGGSGLSPLEEVTGRIEEIVRDQGFVVRYTGTTRQSRRYTRHGDAYVREGAAVLTHCGGPS